MSRLGHHPNIIKFVGVCFLPEFPQLPALIMEKVPYGNLQNYLKKQGPENSMELSRKRHILLGVANGLHYLHYECEMAVVHMDLKATIVLLTESYDAKISGFRKACMVSDKELASNDHVCMPPEVISHAETTRCTPTIDIFSFGVLALFTLNQVRSYIVNANQNIYNRRYFGVECY
jgi:serine/threonine protein kinase